MAINFPDSPTTGDSFTAAGRTWVWDGTTWNAASPFPFDALGLDTTAGATADIGELVWNATDETIDVGLNSEVTLQVGEEHLVRVKNVTGSDIPNGTLVMFSGAQGDFITVAPAVTNGSVSHHYMVGITTQAIADTELGFVTTEGFVRGLDTSLYAPGTILYANPTTPGALTSTEPTAPAFKAPVAAVTKQGPGGSGQILVRMTSGESLDHLHDVQLSSLADGQSLVYNATSGVWENALAGMGIVAVSSNITLAASNRYFVDTNAARTLTLPTSPSVGDEIWIIDQTNLAATNNITVNNGGSLINGVSDTLVIDADGAVATLLYTGSTLGWRI